MLMPHKGLRLSCALLLAILFPALLSAQTQDKFPTPEAFASALLAAPSAAERQALMQTGKPLLTIELRQILLAQGDKLLNQRKWEQALHAFQVAREVASEINDQAGLASALHKIGTVYFAQNRFVQTLDYFQQGLAIRRGLPDRQAIFESLRNVGAVQRFLGNTSASLAALEEAESMLPEIKEINSRAALNNGLGLTYRAMGDNLRALAYAQKALELYEQNNDKIAVAGMQANIGNVYHAQGDHDLAMQYMRKSLETSEAIADKSLMSIAQNTIGNIYFAKGDYRLAMEFYQKSLKLKEEVNDSLGISNTLSNIGRLYYKQGEYEKALPYLNQSLAGKRVLGDKPGIGGVLVNLGLIYREQKEYDKAAAYFQESLQIGKDIRSLETVSESLNNLGTIYYEQGDPAKALQTFQEGLAMRESTSNKKGVSSSLGNLAFFYLQQGNPVEALKAVERACAMDKQSGNLDDLWYSLALKGHVYKMLGQTAQARQDFAEAVELIELLRTQAAGDATNQQNFMLKKISPYHQLIELLVEEKHLEKALYYAERSKAGLLLNILHSGKVTITKTMSDAEKEQERLLKDEINSYTNQLERERLRPRPEENRLASLQEHLKKSLADQQAFQADLYARHPELKIQRGQTPAFNLAQAADLLTDRQTALLEYAATADKIYLFVLTKSAKRTSPTLKVYELPETADEVGKAVEEFRGLLATHNLVFRASATRLYDLLLKPAQAVLQGKTRLVIVPDQTLWELPFQALQAGDGHYLIEHFAISYAPSLSVLSEMRKQQDRNTVDKKAANLLAFANPALNPAEANPTAMRGITQAEESNYLAPLPETEAEVNLLKELYGKERSRIYTGANASEERLKSEAASYRILHLATHGLLNNASPMYSQLVLSQATTSGKEDGFLEAWEIAQLDLGTDLVVLSACETARGRLSAGEGVIGLTWSFFVAGSAATLVSQWKVDEASTADLMVEFHRHLQTANHGLQASDSKAEALRKATLKLLQTAQYRHPFYWAAFVLIGDTSVGSKQ
jgi:CHAT domain-containing protein/Tfp pilus assembly protein PilF